MSSIITHKSVANQENQCKTIHSLLSIKTRNHFTCTVWKSECKKDHKTLL